MRSIISRSELVESYSQGIEKKINAKYIQPEPRGKHEENIR
jgi:hypothetical protein